MVRTAAKTTNARKVLPESSDSEESESQPETSRYGRKTTREQPQKQQNPSTSRSRKQSQPKQKTKEKDVQPPRRPQASGSASTSTPRETPLLRDIRILQQRPENNIIPKAPFGRLIKEIIQSHGDFRITKDAFDCIKEALEAYLVELFEDSYRLALHRKRVTLVPADMSLVLYLRGSRDPGYSVRN